MYHERLTLYFPIITRYFRYKPGVSTVAMWRLNGNHVLFMYGSRKNHVLFMYGGPGAYWNDSINMRRSALYGASGNFNREQHTQFMTKKLC